MTTLSIPAKVLYAASMFTGNDKHQPHLDAVHIEMEHGTVTIVSTDGHRLFKYELGITESTENYDGKPKTYNLLLTGYLIKALKAKNSEYIKIFLDDLSFQVIKKDGNLEYASKFEQSELLYPNWKRVIPEVNKKFTGSLVLGVNTDYIKSFGDAVKIMLGVKTPQIKIIPTSENGLLLIAAAHDEELPFLGVLMPVRIKK